MAAKQRPAAGVLPLPLLIAAAVCSWASMITCAAAAAAAAASAPPVRAVNLGGWLVVEGWIEPNPFDNISHDELLDGTKICIQSANKNTYLSAEDGGGTVIVANRSAASSWETFTIWRRPGRDSKFRLRAYHNQFVGLSKENDPTPTVVAAETDPERADEFEIIRDESNRSRIRIRAPNGSFLQVTSEAVTADYGSESTSWDNSDPSVFIMEIHAQMRGEFQLCNFYGLDTAGSVLKDHWDTFIVEDDFRFISSQGLNAVRIPVAWWITMEQGSSGATTNPCDSPFYPGYQEVLDKAFDWADTYNLSVIVDLHAAPGSQNGNEHSASRDGSLQWPNDEANIRRTVDAIRALANRYGSRGSLLAMELLNEPSAEVPLETLESYYREGYRAVRESSSDAYVIMSARLSGDPPEILDFMAGGGFDKCVVDVHYYNLFDDSTFGHMTLEQNINYVRTERTQQLRDMQREGGPLVFVGEWTAEWSAKSNPSDGDYGEFARAQMEVFGGASFGWAYWTYRRDDPNDPGWSLKEMIQRGIVVSFT